MICEVWLVFMGRGGVRKHIYIYIHIFGSVNYLGWMLGYIECFFIVQGKLCLI